MPKSWHTRRERKMIKDFGGTPKKQYGVDGVLDGKPVEARVAKKDHRFRLGCDVHDELVSKGGSYLFDKIGDGKPAKKVSASRVDKMLGDGPCFKDRDYPHKFVDVDDIF